TRSLHTLSLLAKSSKILCETDRLSITYHLSSPAAFLDHLRQVTASEPDALALASLMTPKAVEKYDGFIPESLLNEANAQSKLSVSEALEVCAKALQSCQSLADRP
ncbi:MAG TPA: hypothetical protein P5055_09220, partial [Candidatus Paceibacterota bacterium]|nr:hypothetical protein [Candidatus Paceibacterota bacterium]